MKCKYCEDLNKEKYKIEISEIRIEHGFYYDWECEMRYCPYCGEQLIKYKNSDKNTGE